MKQGLKSGLANLKLDGIDGISGDGEVFSTFFDEDYGNTMLVMNGKEVVQKNKLTRVMYRNPHYLVSDNMSAYKRLVGLDYDETENPVFNLSGVIHNLMFGSVGIPSTNPAGDAFKKLQELNNDGVPVARKLFAREELSKELKKFLKRQDPPEIKKLNQLVRFFYEFLIHIENTIQDKEDLYGFFSNLDKHDLKDYIAKTMVKLVKEYEPEGEWRLKGESLVIPEGSKLFIIMKNLPEQSRERELKKLIKSNNLIEKFGVRAADASKVKSWQDEYRGSEHIRLMNKPMEEDSYTTEDIPVKFRIAFNFERAQESLVDMEFKNIKGISGDGNITFEFFGERLDRDINDALLLMNGTEVEKKNNLSRIMYTNPKYLVSKNMSAFKRLLDINSDNPWAFNYQQVFSNLLTYMHDVSDTLKKNKKLHEFFQAFQYSSKSIREAIFLQDKLNPLSNKEPEVKSIKDLAKFTLKAFENYAKQHDYLKDLVKEIPLNAVIELLSALLTEAGREYIREGEWVVKDGTLAIPKKSRLFLLTKNNPNVSEEEFEEMIAELKLEEKYTVIRYDRNRFIQLKRKRKVAKPNMRLLKTQ